MDIAICFALALLLSTALVPVAIRYASVLGLVDEPDGDRKIHSDPIPRCGGIAIAIAVFIPALFWLRDVSSLFGFFTGALIIAIFGFLDDRHDLSYKWKFFGQIIAVLVFLFGNVEITKTPFLGLGDLVSWLSFPFMALFILGVTNAVNLSDGLDGLAAGSSLLSLGFIAYLGLAAGDTSYVLIAVATMGALMGFLRFNTHPASVFMGDAGSQFLGFVTACLAIMVTQSSGSAVSPLLAIVVVGLPILDTLSVMLLRIRDGQSPFNPDQRHLHHQFLSVGLLHYQAVAALYFLNFLLLLMAYTVRFEADIVVLLSYLLFCAITLGLINFLKQSAYGKRRRKLVAETRERRNLWLRRLGWLHNHGAIVIQCLLGVIWLACVFIAPSPPSISGWISVSVFIIAASFRWGSGHIAGSVARLTFYTASAISVFVATYRLDAFALGWVHAHSTIDTMFVVLVLFLGLSIRLTRRDVFRLDTQDILVVLILLAAPLLTIGSDNSNEIIGSVVRLAVLLYTAEFIIGRSKDLTVMTCFALLTLSIVGVRAFI